jgi:nitroreductase
MTGAIDKTQRIAAVEEAITSRRAIRAFLPDPIDRALVEHLLDVAARAPSGTNMQPWRAHVLTGEPLRRFCDAVCAAHDDPAFKPGTTWRYYPETFFEPYQSRRRKVGWDLYALLGIARGEHRKMHDQHGRNFRFFDAPVGMIFTIDRRLEIGSWLDYGMFLANLMTAARAHGLDTCPQAAFAPFHAVVAEQLGLAEEEVTVCGVALGRADLSAPENALVTEREPAARFATFHG